MKIHGGDYVCPPARWAKRRMAGNAVRRQVLTSCSTASGTRLADEKALAQRRCQCLGDDSREMVSVRRYDIAARERRIAEVGR